jgi:hypothetical protein
MGCSGPPSLHCGLSRRRGRPTARSERSSLAGARAGNSDRARSRTSPFARQDGGRVIACNETDGTDGALQLAHWLAGCGIEAILCPDHPHRSPHAWVAASPCLSRPGTMTSVRCRRTGDGRRALCKGRTGSPPAAAPTPEEDATARALRDGRTRRRGRPFGRASWQGTCRAPAGSRPGERLPPAAGRRLDATSSSRPPTRCG